MNRALLAVLIAAPFVFAMGCGSESERLVRMAKESAERQAEQNNEMSRLNREVAQSHRELVELQRDVEERAATGGGQRDLLEEERRQIAGERVRESILGPLIANLGPLLVCALVLLFCSILLFGLRAERDGDDVVAEILIEELTSSAPKLIPPVDGGLAAIEDDRPRLPGEVVRQPFTGVRRTGFGGRQAAPVGAVDGSPWRKPWVNVAGTTRIAPAGAKENTGANHLSPLPGLRVLAMPRSHGLCRGLSSSAPTGAGLHCIHGG